MKRNLKALGAFALMLAMTLLLTAGPACMAASAEEAAVEDPGTGYLLILAEAPATLFSLDPMEQATLMAAANEREELLPLAENWGIYRASSLEEVQSLVHSGQVLVLEPDYPVELFDAVTDPAKPDDPYFTSAAGYQGNLTGEYGIHAPAAWNAGLTGEGVTIAVLDSGVNADHVDAPENITEGRYYFFREEANGLYEIMVDGATHRCNYYSSDNVTDEIGHGSMVTGIIAAKTDNAIGIAGMAPKATILPIKCFTKVEGHWGGTSSVMISAVNYAVAHDADVINMSWGLRNHSQTLETAINNAAAAGCILVAAVGNDGATGSPQYPAAFDKVLGVGATDRGGYLASFSQRNNTVDVCAPGSQIYSLSSSSANGILSKSGTSFSAPQVTAAAGLMRQADPTMTQAEFLELLRTTSGSIRFNSDDDPAHGGVGLMDLERMMDATGHSDLRFRKDEKDSVVARAVYHPLQSDTLIPDASAVMMLGAYNAQGHLLDSKTGLIALDEYGAYALAATLTPPEGEKISEIQAFYLKNDASLQGITEPLAQNIE